MKPTLTRSLARAVVVLAGVAAGAACAADLSDCEKQSVAPLLARPGTPPSAMPDADVSAAIAALAQGGTVVGTTASQRRAALRAYTLCLQSDRQFRINGGRQGVEAEAQYQNQSARLLEIRTAAEGRETFMGMNFGVGMGFSQAKSSIAEAAVVNGVVTATKSERQRPRIVLEAHYYGVCEPRPCTTADYGFGPFFAIAPEGDKAIASFALGLMLGARDKSAGASAGFSIGLGAVLDREVKMLAPGIEEGKPLPAGETTPRIITRSKWSPLLFFTRTF